MTTENPFVKLFAIDFKDHLEVKKSGNTDLKYVSWAYAWAEVKKLYPSASYEVKKFNGLPYVYDPITGFMVYTSVTIEGVSHEMWLACTGWRKQSHESCALYLHHPEMGLQSADPPP